MSANEENAANAGPGPEGQAAEDATAGPTVYRGDVVNVSQSRVDAIYATEVHLSDGAAIQVESESFSVSQGAVALAQTSTLTADRSAVGAASTDSLTLVDSAAGALATGRADLSDARVGVLVAGQVHGTVTTLLDARGAAVAGLAAGLGLGLMWALGRLLGGRD